MALARANVVIVFAMPQHPTEESTVMNARLVSQHLDSQPVVLLSPNDKSFLCKLECFIGISTTEKTHITTGEKL